MNRQDASKILGVSLQANEEGIKKAFRKKAMLLHPDRNKAPDARIRFIELHEAYEYLTDSPEEHSRSEAKRTNKSHYPASQKPKFRSSSHVHRSYTNPYESMSQEEFEERYRRAQKAAEEMLDRKSQIIYQNSLQEYQDTWRRKFALVMAIIGVFLALLFTIDYTLGTSEQKLANDEVQLKRFSRNRVISYYLYVNDVAYSLPDNLRFLYDNTNPIKYTYINGQKIPLTPNNIASFEDHKLGFTLNRTSVFKDITGVTIHFGPAYYKLQPIFSAFGSFPLVPIFLLIPFISLWRERAKFNFVFFIVNYNIYVFPIFILVLLFHDGRLLRLFGL